MKKIFSLALMTAACGAANAQVAVYGLFDVGYGKAINTSAAGDKADIHSGGDNGNNELNSTSRFGIKGSTDVGSGVKANFRLESNGITSNGDVNGTFFNRKAWFGLSGGMGEVRIGKQDSVPFQTFVDYDLNGASNGVSSWAYAGTAPWLRGRQDRSVQYIAPAMGAVKVQLGFVPAGNVAGGKATVSGGVTFAAGKLSVSGAFETKRTDTGTNFSAVGGSYDFGIAKVVAAYANGGTGAKGVSLGGQFTVAGTNIGAQLGKNADSKARAYEVFVNREVFKSTYGYVEMGNLDNKGTPIAGTGTKTKATGYATGLIYVF